jgi:hypothetical protein
MKNILKKIMNLVKVIQSGRLIKDDIGCILDHGGLKMLWACYLICQITVKTV